MISLIMLLWMDSVLRPPLTQVGVLLVRFSNSVGMNSKSVHTHLPNKLAGSIKILPSKATLIRA